MENVEGTIHLKPGRAKPVANRHPWIFSGAIRRITGSPKAGALVDVVGTDGGWLARGYYNPRSQISARILTWDEESVVDEQFWAAKLTRAISARDILQLEPHTTAYRLVNAEADGLPGLVVDKYGDYVVVQCTTLGIDQRKEQLFDFLQETLQPTGLIERSDVSVRKKEGLIEAVGIRRGVRPPDRYTIHENDHLFHADLLSGHKTGLYLDQRDNRRQVGQRRFLAGKAVLNVFSYTGGFAIYAAASGARAITNVDSSAAILAEAQHNMAANGYQARPDDEYVTGNAFEVLRQYRDAKRLFDVVILDPPKFAQSKRDVDKACRGYKDLNWLAMRLLRPGGLLATFSCSGLVSTDLFQKVLFGAAVDAGREAQILYNMGQGADHPVLLTFPESAYLKGFLCRIW